MSITSVNSSSSTTSSTDMSALSGNYEMFLQLLVTQLQNQSPLDPMDSSKFTEQLVQYSSVEQQIKANQSLTDLKTSFAVQSALSFVNYVGKTVTVDSSTTELKEGAATWNFNGTSACEAAEIKIYDANGALVYSATEKLASGDGKYEWSGETNAGGTAPAGSYTIAISGKDSAGKAITYKSETTGVVTALDFSTSTVPMLKIGNQLISAYLVKSVQSSS